MGTEVKKIQELDQDTIIDLFELSGYNSDAPNDSFRFCNYTGIKFGGKSYTPLAASIEAIEYTSEGAQPEPTLTIGDKDGVVTNLILLYNNMEGANINIIRTQVRYLDGNEFADPNAKLADADFIIARRENHSPHDAVVFALANPIEVDGAKLPRRLCLRTCSWEYRDPDTCGYTGSTMYTVSNQKTIDSTQDRCSHSILGCELRFGRNRVLPFGGFPGLQRRS